MRKILYITYIDKKDKKHTGVMNKVLYQSNSFNELGNICYYGFFESTDVYSIQREEEVVKRNLNAKTRRKARQKLVLIIEEFVKSNSIDLVYIRGESFDNLFLKMISMLNSNGIKIILEIPTYPLKNEIKVAITKQLKLKKYLNALKILVSTIIMLFCIPKFKKYISLIVTYMEYESIWNIPVCTIDNAIDCNMVSVKSKFDRKEEIVLLGVANVSIWHGFDRIIKGIKNFNGSKKIKFLIVGEGAELPQLKEQVQKLELEEQIEFLGQKNHKELDELFNYADIAVSSLGMHRINMINGSTLKTKEYSARGIPFILAYNEKKLSSTDNNRYFMKFESNEVPINIDKIVNFYEEKNLKEISKELRLFAENHYSWTSEIEKVFLKLNE